MFFRLGLIVSRLVLHAMHTQALISVAIAFSFMRSLRQLVAVRMAHLEVAVLGVLELIVPKHAAHATNTQAQKANAAGNDTCNSSSGQFSRFVHFVLLLQE